MQYIGPRAAGKSVDRLGMVQPAPHNPTDPPRRVPRRRRIDPVSDMLGWATGLVLVTLVVLVSWAWVQRVRRSAKGEAEGGEPDPESLLEAVREAYFEGEIDRAEYEQVRQKLRGDEGTGPSALAREGESGPPRDLESPPGESVGQ